MDEFFVLSQNSNKKNWQNLAITWNIPQRDILHSILNSYLSKDCALQSFEYQIENLHK